MSNRLVLRFGNQIAETYDEHETVLTTHGMVWWGWWAKDEESDLSLDEQADIARLIQEAPIGLYNSHTGEAFRAICTDVRFGSRERPIASPDPELTPSYYRNRKVRGWFNLVAIERLQLGEFQGEFGDPPGSRQTMFWQDELLVSPKRVFRRLRVPTVLHLSDIHFGDDFGFNGVFDDATSINVADRLELKITEILEKRGHRVGVVVASGDLITGGEHYWQDVTNFFDFLLEALGLERADLVVVPGNHDVWIANKRRDAYPLSYGNETPYRTWYADYFGVPDRPIEVMSSFEADDRVLSFLQLNSCRLRDQETMEYGFVGRDAYLSFLQGIGKPGTRETRIAVMHHHLRGIEQDLRPNPDRPPSMMLDAGQLVEDLQEFGFSLVLHGHKHEDAVQQGGRLRREGHEGVGHLEPLWLVGCGSTGVNPGRLPERTRANSMMFYDLADPNVVRGECLEYTTRSSLNSHYEFAMPTFTWM